MKILWLSNKCKGLEQSQKTNWGHRITSGQILTLLYVKHSLSHNTNNYH